MTARGIECIRQDYGGLANMLVMSLGGLYSLVLFALPASKLFTNTHSSELLSHSHLLKNLEANQAPIYSLWYLLQKLIVGRDFRDGVLTASGLLLLGGFALLKGVMLTGLLRSSGYGFIKSLFGGILLGTAVALPLPFIERYSPLMASKTQYLGTIPANTFMSATQLIANVGVLPAFYALQLWGIRKSQSNFVIMLLTCLIATVAKPGIAPALLIGIAGCIAISCCSSRKITTKQLWQLVIAAVLLLTPSTVISHFYMSGNGWLSIEAVIAPLATWQAFSSQIVVDFLTSFAFPLTVLVLLFISSKTSESRLKPAKTTLSGLAPSIFTTVAALLMFICFAEKSNGSFVHSGNFIWAAISANAGWHLTSLIALKSLMPRSQALATAILCLEAIGGLKYVTGYVNTGSFL
jgi:hypothetical protein